MKCPEQANLETERGVGGRNETWPWISSGWRTCPGTRHVLTAAAQLCEVPKATGTVTVTARDLYLHEAA